MRFDPAATLSPEQQRVVASSSGLLLVDGPSVSGRTTALLHRAMQLLRTNQVTSRRDQTTKSFTSEALKSPNETVVFIAPTFREADRAAELVSMATGGTAMAALSITALADLIIAVRAPSLSRSDWKRTARALLDAECSDRALLDRLWPTMSSALSRASVRANAIETLVALRCHDGRFLGDGPFVGAGSKWQELNRFGNRVAKRVNDASVHDPITVVRAAIALLQTSPVGNPLTGSHLLVDDAHRFDRIYRQLIAALVEAGAAGPASTVIAGNGQLTSWSQEFDSSATGEAPVGTRFDSPAPHSISLPVLSRTPPTIGLRRLRHRALEADALMSNVEDLHKSGIPYAHIAIIVPSLRGPLAGSLIRVSDRKHIPIRRFREPINASPLVSCFVDIVRWVVTRDGPLLDAAQSIGLVSSPTDPRLPETIPNSRRTLAETAFSIWAGIVAKYALDEPPATTDACRLFLSRLQSAASSTGLQQIDPHQHSGPDLLSVIDDSSSATRTTTSTGSAGIVSTTTMSTTTMSTATMSTATMSTSTVSTATMSTSTANPNPAETAFIDELDAIEVLEVGDLAGRSFAHLLIASMVEGSWPRIPTQVEGGWDPRELVAAGVLPHERDQITIARHRAFFADTVARGEISVTAIAAPDPGVLVSRFVEGWPELPTVSLHTEGPLLPESPETRSQVACFPDDSLRLSATRLDTFENCRLNFAYQYVAGVRGPGGVPASVGTMVHATLEAFLLPMAEVTAHEQTEVEARGGATRERLFELLETNWESSAFPYRPQEADYRRRAEDWLERWLETEFPRLQRVIAVEHRFSVRVGQHTLTGSIDRVSVNTDGEVEIVDYKTGSAPRTSNRTDPDNLQLATYHLAAVTDPVLQAFGEPKRLRLHYLAAGADVDQPVRADHEAITKARILAAADAIATEDFYPSVDADCEYCNFKKLCPIQPEGRTIESLRSEKSRPTTGVAASAPAATARRKRTVIAEAPYPVSGVAVVNANDLRADQSVDPMPPTQTNTAQDPAEVDNGFQPLPEQTRAIEHVGSPLLIVAGAGSGKTTVLAKRIVNLVRNHGWRPDQILGLTFSNKASGNLRARVAKELGTGNDAVVMTYHGFGATILRQYGERIGLPTEPILLDRARAWQLLLDSLDDVRIESRKTGNIGLLVNDALALSSSCADHVVSVRAVRAECEWMLNTAALHKGATKTLLDRIDLCAMAEAYELAKRATGCIDFGDQIRLALQLVEEHGDVAETLRNTFPVALLDEYQDTNYAQRRLIEVLYRGSNELTAVGDDMQSIYGFRGAHIRNLLSFESHFPGATECRLETNHRSGPEIVALAEHIQGQVDNARPKQLIASGRIPIAHIERFIAADDFEEAQLIANRCLQLHAEGQSWSEIAILCRKRRLIAPISETLMAAGVPVEVFGLGGLLQRPEIIDAISWLEIVAAPEGQVPPAPRGEANASNGKLAPPDPSVSLLRILRSEPYRLGMRDLAALSRAARNWARANGSDQNDMLDILVALNELSETADLSTEAWTRLHAFNTVRVPLVEARDRQPLADFVEMVLDRTGIWRRVDARGYENLTRFVDLAARFVALPIAGRGSWFGRRSLLEFLEYLELIALSDDELSEAVGSDVDAVNIMTIHQAKGLEFETVFVPGLAGKAGSRSKIFPDGRPGENGITQAVALPPWMKGDADRTPPPLRSTSDLEAPKIEADRERDREEKRLFYVAATRAKSRVILSTAHWYAGVMQPQGPSPFYDLLGETVPPVVETSRSAPPLQDPKIAEMERRNDRYRAEMSMNANRDNSDPVTPDRRSRRGKSGGGATPQGSLFLSEVGANERPAILIPLPNAFATTSLVTYARCPRRFFWTTIRPLPRRASDAARIGTEVHKWIEQQANGQLSLGSLEATPDGLEPSPMNEMNGVDADPDSGEVDPESNEIELIDFIDFIDALAMPREEASGPVGVSGAPVTGSPASGSRGSVARAAYAQSRYANRIPRHVEMPFAIAFEGRVVRGRVDAIYNAHDLGPSNRSSVEIVDFKTGHAPGNSMSGCHPTDPALIDTEPTTIQLDVYGLVAVQVLGFRPDEITVTACYLGGDAGPQYRSRAWTTEEARLANDRVIAALEAIANRRFDPAPGDWCSHCDFESFCEKAATRRTV